MHRYRRRFWLEGTVSVLAAVATLLTLAWPDWIEGVFGVSPDGGSGAVEILISVALAVTAVTFGCVAYAERRASAQVGGV